MRLLQEELITVKTGLLVVLCSLSCVLPLMAQDVVVFHNGDWLSGKIKRMVRGKLIVDSPALDGDAKVDWQQIERVESARTFQFQTKKGLNFLATVSDQETTPARPSPIPRVHQGPR